MSFELARKPTCPVSNFVTASRTVGVQSRTTRAHLGRYIRAAATLPRSVVHYAISGVESQTLTLRLRCRPGVFHRRVAPPRSPLRAYPSSSIGRPLLMSSRLSPCPRPTARQRCGSPFFRKYVVFATSCLTSSRAAAGSSASATQSLFKFLLANSAYATSSSSSTGDEEVTRNKGFSFLNFGERLDEELHRVALWHSWFSILRVPERSGRTNLMRVPAFGVSGAPVSVSWLCCVFAQCFSPSAFGRFFRSLRAAVSWGFTVSSR